MTKYSSEQARIILFQSRYNEYQQVIKGHLDWYHLDWYQQQDVEYVNYDVVGIPSTAVIIILNDLTIKSSNLLAILLQESLRNASYYWKQLSLYIGYNSYFIDDEQDLDVVEFNLLETINNVVPIKMLLDVQIKAYDHHLPKEASCLKIYQDLMMLVYESGDHDYDHVVLLNDLSQDLVDKQEVDEREYNHLLRDMERYTPDTLIDQERLPNEVLVYLPASCASSYEAIARCNKIHHIRLPMLLIDVYDGQLLPSNVQQKFQQDLVKTRSALAAITYYIQDLLRPFQQVTYLTTTTRSDLQELVDDNEDNIISTTSLSSLQYVESLVENRQILLHAEYRKGVKYFQSTYQRQKLLLNPDMVKYGQQDVFYDVICSTNDCSSSLLSSYIATRSERAVVSPPSLSIPKPLAKIAFFTTILGDYEASLPKVVQQQEFDVDFICFTNSKLLKEQTERDVDNIWTIDDYPYHLDENIWNNIDHDSFVYMNSVYEDVKKQQEQDVKQEGGGQQYYYNIVKFYKMNFYLFPRMKQYDYIVWLDGTIEIHNEMTAKIIYKKLQDIGTRGFHVMLFEHTRKTLKYEAMASANDKRWKSTSSLSTPNLLTQQQKKNNVTYQYEVYQELGYQESNWLTVEPNRPLYGLWVTCFIAYDMTDSSTHDFLRSWFTHVQLFSSQCQMSFCFLSMMNKISDENDVPFRPYSLPDLDIHGTNRVNTLFRKKRYHGSSSI